MKVGGSIVTTTRPDSSTVIRTSFIDGQMKSISGTGTYAMSYDYGLHSENGGGLYTQVTKANGTEWTKTYADQLGRTFQTEYADGALESVAYYSQSAALGSRGQVASTTDADGVTTFFAYNAEGERVKTTEELSGGQFLGSGMES